MFELEVPFIEKDQVKGLGARWNAQTKKWFVPAGIDMQLFRKWWPADINVESITAVASCSLSYFLNRVRNTINQAFPDREWIVAEISEFTAHNGNYFLTLVEYDEAGHKQAQINARIWRDKTVELNTKFENATGATLCAGIKVLLLASISFHPQYGMALTIEDVDPNYTLGDMVAKINKIKEVLQQEKIIINNKLLPVPSEFTRVAVISPAQAAGLGDFNREADLLNKYNLCEFVYFTAVFQGKAAPAAIVQSIQEVLAMHQQNPFDALVIIRGGGSVADLAWLNDLELARAICLCPLHVMVGVGHKRDYTVLDEVAGGRFDTPSKVIAHIFQLIIHNAKNAMHSFIDCIKFSHNMCVIVENEIGKIINIIRSDIEFNIAHFSREISTVWQSLIENLHYILIAEERNLEALMREIICQGPEAILSKGFAMASNLTGEIIASCKEALENQSFKLTFYDGSLIVKTSSE